MEKIIFELRNDNNTDWLIASNKCTTLKDLTTLCDELKVNTNLKTIFLRLNNIGVEGAKIIGDMLEQNRSLTAIYLSENQIGDAGLKHILNAVEKNNVLEILSVAENNITDVGVKYIIKMFKTRSTQQNVLQINLYGNYKITENGFKLFADNIIRSNINFQQLYILHSKMTNSSIKYIVDALEHNRYITEFGPITDIGFMCSYNDIIIKICKRNKHNMNLSNLKLVDFS
jgi:Ran GTPase-activating protein (RanGAP) involved in mRNA processing and transport